MIAEILNTEVKRTENEGLILNYIKSYRAGHEHSVPFQIPNFSVLLIKKGNLKIKFSSSKNVTRRKDLLVIPVNTICTYLLATHNIQLYVIRTSFDFVLDNFYNRELADAFSMLVLKTEHNISLDEKDFTVLSMIYKLMYVMQRETDSPELYRDFRRIGFTLFVYELKFILYKYLPNVNLDLGRKESLLIQFLTVLAIHIKKHHHVQFYAGSLYVTPGHLNKMVKMTTGKSAKNFIIEALINESKNLLSDTHGSIAKIADELEFSSAAYFSAFFKKHTGLLPSEFRSSRKSSP